MAISSPGFENSSAVIKSDPVDRLWQIAELPWIDPAALRAAVRRIGVAPDHRTALLVQEAGRALRDHTVGHRRPPAGARFPYLWSALVEPTDPAKVKRMLRELGTDLDHEERLPIGGSIALMWKGLLRRATQGIDAVDEVPQALGEAARRHRLERRYALKLTSFQSHYLPDDWQDRLLDQGSFGRLHVLLVHPLDVMTSKLFSRRSRDLDDLRAITSDWSERQVASWRNHVRKHSGSLRRDTGLAEAAARNWTILYGRELFTTR